MIFKALGLYHPFFRPVIRRVITVAVIVVWSAFELAMGNTGWAGVTLVLAVICAIGFFIKFDPDQQGGDDA